jgi:hypothetical protein
MLCMDAKLMIYGMVLGGGLGTVARAADEPLAEKRSTLITVGIAISVVGAALAVNRAQDLTLEETKIVFDDGRKISVKDLACRRFAFGFVDPSLFPGPVGRGCCPTY